MPYLGKSPNHGNFTELTDVSGSFNGSTTQFALTSRIGGVAITPVIEAAVLISINGVIQEPTTDYTVSGTNITFTTAPASGDSFFGTVMGFQLDVGTPSDSTITQAKLASTFLTGASDIGAAIVDADLLLIDDGAGGNLRKTTASRLKTYIDSANPASADGDTRGTASLEWSDLYLADGGVIYFGADQDINITHVADTGLTTNGDFSVGDDLKLTSDAAVLGFGADNDVTLTHVADTGVLLNSTMAIQFNDASQYINAPSNAILDINATDEIELNATLIDINGNLDVSGPVTLADGSLAIADLDIDGGTDIGEAIVDADLFIVDNGAGGTNRKTTASRLKTYIGSISQANQAALEAQTNEDTYAPPDLMHHHPGMVKAWCKWDIAVTVNASHNVSSVTDSATGLWTINWNTDFSSVNYAVACSWRDDNDKVEFQCRGGSSAAGTYEFKLVNGGGSFVDAAAADDMHVIAVGDH